MPGGADMGYCKTFNGAGNRRIAQFVYRGGAYLGLCAGGYYGSGRCEFEVGDPKMEVVGSRELSFFPGTCRGLAFAGFVYGSDVGARAAKLRVKEEAFKGMKSTENLSPEFKSYYNGGGVFVDAEKYEDQKVQILASYTEDLNVESGSEKAALVHCKIGEGNVVLSGVHPEYEFPCDALSILQLANRLDSDSQVSI
jgi:biotin---protein ligase